MERTHLSRRVRLAVLGATISTLVTAGAVSLAGVTAASAEPTSCRTGYGPSSSDGFAICYEGTGQYRVSIKCDARWPTSDYWKKGPWRSVGSYQYSEASCSNGDQLIIHSIDRQWFG